MSTAAETTPEPQGQGPLAGLRILDLATIIAAPMASTLLSDYGADVLKVELPGRGDGVRYFPPFKDGQSLWWKVINRNKRFITLDLHQADGIHLLKQLLPRFDVLVENFRPGTLDGWGLPREVLWAINPKLVILRVTGFGQTGPYSDQPGFARIFEALGGLTYLTGEPDGEPMHSGYPLGDAVGGLFGAIAMLAALWPRARNRDLPGEEIDLSLTEGILKVLDYLPIEHQQLGVVRGRSGNANQYSAPSLVCQSADGRWFSLAGSTDALFARNCAAIGQPGLAQDPRFANNGARVQHGATLNHIFRGWCAVQTGEQVMAAFHAAGGTIAPIYNAADIAVDPHFAARQAIVDVPDIELGSVKMPAVVPRFAGAPTALRHSARAMGHDNDTVYGDWLGLSADERQRLKAAKVI